MRMTNQIELIQVSGEKNIDVMCSQDFFNVRLLNNMIMLHNCKYMHNMSQLFDACSLGYPQVLSAFSGRIHVFICS